jgi:hypothetical protein
MKSRSINALPSYLIAVVWLGLWGSMSAQLAMLAAVVTFILGYSVLTAWWPALREDKSIFARALKVGLAIRVFISVITVIAVPFGIWLIFTPDYWCGQIAVGIIGWLYEQAGLEATLGSRYNDGYVDGTLQQPGFMEVYLATLLEGLILSFMLFIFSFLSIIILQMRDRRNPLLWQGRPNP